MALPDIPTRSPLRDEVPTLEEFAELTAQIEELIQRVVALENPAAPGVPVIGTATAGIESVQITFTAASGGQPATSFTATAYSGATAVGTVTGASSPLTITGLDAGVVVSVKVRAANTSGSSAESVASNSVTPTPAPELPADDFSGPDATTLGTSSSGHTWLGDPVGTWERKSGKAEANTTGVAWNPAWIPVDRDDYLVSVETTHGAGEWGVCARVVNHENFYYLDYEYISATTAMATLYKRVNGSVAQLATEEILGLSDGVAMRLQLKVQGNQITGYANRASNLDNAVGGPVTDTQFASGGGAGIVSLVVVTPHVTVDNFAVTGV